METDSGKSQSSAAMDTDDHNIHNDVNMDIVDGRKRDHEDNAGNHGNDIYKNRQRRKVSNLVNNY